MLKIIVVTPSIRPEYLNITQDCLERQTFQNFEWLVEVGLPSRGFTLPSAMNNMLRVAKGDIVVSLQDCITIPPNFLEDLLKLDLTKAWTFPVVKENTNGDWRLHRDGNTSPEEWEMDLACAPLSFFKDVGGFDESYCNGWSYDNVEIAIRAKAAGYSFMCNPYLIGMAIDHDEIIPHPFRKKLISNKWRVEFTRDEAARGNYNVGEL
jgi:glycosyltransferase involved in cell wall biosynthesis